MRRRVQEGVSIDVLDLIKEKYQQFMDKAGFRQREAFQQTSNTIEGITVGGKTVRRIFQGLHMHPNTIRTIVEGFGRKTFLEYGILSLVELEETKTCETLKSQ